MIRACNLSFLHMQSLLMPTPTHPKSPKVPLLLWCVMFREYHLIPWWPTSGAAPTMGVVPEIFNPMVTLCQEEKKGTWLPLMWWMTLIVVTTPVVLGAVEQYWVLLPTGLAMSKVREVVADVHGQSLSAWCCYYYYIQCILYVVCIICSHISIYCGVTLQGWCSWYGYYAMAVPLFATCHFLPQDR